ncbi:MAG TPA: biotin attachment protein [Caldisericia bacterium]|jgi:pyruvate/2-oxoglutarate dehydrogenase complex dihydrolipoamide acyltransferase (E2) component|nr:biotin attachment protein [Caldisericia bacterium]HPB33231.1 biotin attachment protein [Caldisericia bacterium]HQL67304.1 biotin attachment protein [Caldisericia bacterium]HQN47988.1 biotin attachment protein [Caldisericia bacterium]HQO99072.1 biotin attachment protein [Caldisericia bacterium]
MIIDVTVPKWGLTMKEVEIVKWLKKEGDMVEKDEPLVEVTTEKISNTINAPEKGKLVKILTKEGETAFVAAVIAQIETE